MSDKQLKRDKVFLEIAYKMASLSECPSRKVGAVLVNENMIVSTGYNGAPKGINVECPRCSGLTIKPVQSGEHLDLCLDVHAEINCIIQAAYYGVSSAGCIIYCTTKLCLNCLAACINAGIKKVYYREEYNVEYPVEFLQKIEVVRLV